MLQSLSVSSKMYKFRTGKFQLRFNECKMLWNPKPFFTSACKICNNFHRILQCYLVSFLRLSNLLPSIQNLPMLLTPPVLHRFISASLRTAILPSGFFSVLANHRFVWFTFWFFHFVCLPLHFVLAIHYSSFTDICCPSTFSIDSIFHFPQFFLSFSPFPLWFWLFYPLSYVICFRSSEIALNSTTRNIIARTPYFFAPYFQIRNCAHWSLFLFCSLEMYFGLLKLQKMDHFCGETWTL